MDIQRVVIGIDFTAASLVAAKWVANHVAGNSEMILAYSIYAPQPPRFLKGRYPPIESLLQVARDGAERKLRDLGDTLPCDFIWKEVRVGAPADELPAVARDFHADLIVVGAHTERHGFFGRSRSTAEQLISRSPVPVLLAANVRDVRPRRILVALDDADITPAVLRWAQFLGNHFDARVTAVHVIGSAVLSHVLSVRAATGDDQISDQLVVSAEFKNDADRWMQSLLDTGLDSDRVDSEVLFGEAGQEIVAAAERLGSELIVMGSRGAGSLGKRVLGSVASEVLRAAACPVLVVTEDELRIERPVRATPAEAEAGAEVEQFAGRA
jgi:universal stress protein E